MNNLFLFIILLAAIFAIAVLMHQSYGEKRECEDLVSSEKWGSQAHDDNKASNKEFKKSLYQDSLCEFGQKVDDEKIDGAVKDYTEFKTTHVYNTSTREQRECLNEGHDSPDDDGDKNLAGYEIEYCAWDQD